jgi:hypothetical protein
MPLMIGDTSIDAGSEESSASETDQKHFKHYLPPWNLVMAALAGIFGISWGWWNLRMERRENISTVIFFAGFFIWGYAVCGLLWWSFEL